MLFVSSIESGRGPDAKTTPSAECNLLRSDEACRLAAHPGVAEAVAWACLLSGVQYHVEHGKAGQRGWRSFFVGG